MKPGDIGLTINKGFVPKAIRFFMNMYRKSLGLKERTVYNHVFTVIDVWGKTYVAEAMSNGFNIRPAAVYDKLASKGKVKIKVPKKPYTDEEKRKISQEATKLTFSPTRYDYLNFWYQLKMIVRMSFTKGEAKWSGPIGRKAARRLYCSESAAYLANKVRPDTFKESASTNPLDIDINKNYKDLHATKKRNSKKVSKKV